MARGLWKVFFFWYYYYYCLIWVSCLRKYKSCRIQYWSLKKLDALLWRVWLPEGLRCRGQSAVKYTWGWEEGWNCLHRNRPTPLRRTLLKPMTSFCNINIIYPSLNQANSKQFNNSCWFLIEAKCNNSSSNSHFRLRTTIYLCHLKITSNMFLWIYFLYSY